MIRAASLVFVSVACTACGRFNFDAISADADAALSEDAAHCQTWGPFAGPALVPNINAFGTDLDDWHPSLTGDDLTIYFYSFRNGGKGNGDIWRASRPTRSADFGTPVAVPELNTIDNDFSPTITADGLSLLLASDRTGAANYDIYEARRTTPQAAFASPTLVPVLNSGFAEETVWISPDGLRVYFSSNRGPTDDIYSAARPDLASPFSTPQVVTAVSDPTASDLAPSLSADELELVFSSDRTATDYDIWYAKRSATTQPFSSPQPIPILDSTLDDYAPAFSHDGSELYYTYASPLVGGADANIYVAKRACAD